MVIFRGILSLAWCPCDSDLLLSCGKDNRILCWNPNTESRTGEVIYTIVIVFCSNQLQFFDSCLHTLKPVQSNAPADVT